MLHRRGSSQSSWSEVREGFPGPKEPKRGSAILGTDKLLPKVYQIALPINRFMCKDSPFHWTKDCQTPFEELKLTIMSPPVLHISKRWCIAGNFIPGGTGKDRPVAFSSRAVCYAETRDSKIEREFLAIVWVVNNFTLYLLGRHFKVYTDHKPLRGISNLKNQTSGLAKLRHTLSEYDFEILYKWGRKSQNAYRMHTP